MAPLQVKRCGITWSCEKCKANNCTFLQRELVEYCVDDIGIISGQGYLVDSPETECPAPLRELEDDDTLEGINLALAIAFFLISFCGIFLIRKKINHVLQMLHVLPDGVKELFSAIASIQEIFQHFQRFPLSISTLSSNPKRSRRVRGFPTYASKSRPYIPTPKTNKMSFWKRTRNGLEPNDSSTSFSMTGKTLFTDVTSTSTPIRTPRPNSNLMRFNETSFMSLPSHPPDNSVRPKLPPPPPPRKKKVTLEDSESTPGSHHSPTVIQTSAQVHANESCEPYRSRLNAESHTDSNPIASTSAAAAAAALSARSNYFEATNQTPAIIELTETVTIDPPENTVRSSNRLQAKERINYAEKNTGKIKKPK